MRISSFMTWLAISAIPFISACSSTAEYAVTPASGADAAHQLELVRQGDAALTSGQRDIAVGHYQEAAAIHGGGARAALSLAKLQQEAGDLPAAIATLRAAQDKQLPSSAVPHELVKLYLLTGDEKAVEKLLKKTSVQASEDAAMLNIRALLADRRGEHDAAQGIYRRVLSSDKTTQADREYTTHNLALSLIATNKAEAAAALLKPLAAGAKGKPATRQLLALAYGALGEDDSAYELGLIDLKVEEVEENLRFYRRLREDDFDRRLLFRPASR